MRGVMYMRENGRYKLSSERFEVKNALDYDIHNNSRMGATVYKGLEILKSTMSGESGGSLVILEYGSNDCDHNWREVSEKPDEAHYPLTREENFISLYKKAIGYARSFGARVAMSTLVPIDEDRFLEHISKGLSKENILRWLGNAKILYDFQAHYNVLVKRIAGEEGCPLIDLRSAFVNEGGANLLCEDGIHPNAEGHKVIAQTVYDFVSRS